MFSIHVLQVLVPPYEVVLGSNLLRTFTFQYPRPQFAIFHTLRTIIHILHVCLIPNHPLHKHSVGTLAFTTTMTRAYNFLFAYHNAAFIISFRLTSR